VENWAIQFSSKTYLDSPPNDCCKTAFLPKILYRSVVKKKYHLPEASNGVETMVQEIFTTV
jgi:hypothetical protein